jgi:ligand-binding sensor domain-containing protein/class 3 adenylate cyclase
MASDGAGGLWLGTYGAGILHLDSTGLSAFPLNHRLGTLKIYCLLRDASGTLWIGTEGGGLWSWDGVTLSGFAEKEGLPSRMVYSLAQDRSGSLWVGTYGAGLCRYRGDRFQVLSGKLGLSNDVVLSLHEDVEGSLWVGTYGGGVNQLEDGKVTCFGVPEGLPEDMVSCMIEDRQGALWVGTYGAGLCRIQNGSVTDVYGIGRGLKDASVYSLLEDREGGLWVGTGAGVSRMKGGRWSSFTQADGLASAMVYAIAQTPDGSLWFGTGGGGVSRYSGGRFRTYGTESGLAHRTVVALLVDRRGTLWAGNYGALSRLEGDRFVNVTEREGLSHKMVFCLHEDAEGGLWAGTYGGGLDRVREGRAQGIRQKDGLFDDVVYRILEDGTSRFWMTCNRGVFAVPKTQLADFLEGRIASVASFSLGRADGMRSAECNGGTQPAGLALRDGRLCFPTTRGLVFVDPDRLAPGGPPPPVVLERASYDRTPADLRAGPPLFPPGRGELEFHYSALSFLGPEKIRFAYRLEGFEQEWHDAGGRRTAYYTNIGHGSYRFVVRACNRDGVWNEAGAALAFRIRPHFYETRAFLLLLVAVLASLLGLAYWVRVARLKARQRELEGLVALRTADLKSALRTVEDQRSLLQEFNAQLERKVREQFEQIVRDKRLTKYFPRKLVDKILLSPEDVSLSTEKRVVTTFFTDLTGFTRLSDTADPDRVTDILNEYLSEMAALIESHGGTLARFMGDGILGFFGTPDEMEPAVQAEFAVGMALAMQERMIDLRGRWGLDGQSDSLRLRIGIHQDRVTVGNFGSQDHVEFTALGRGVNLAKRLEEACPPGSVLVTEAVALPLDGRFRFGPVEARRFKGFGEDVRVCLVDGPASA